MKTNLLTGFLLLTSLMSCTDTSNTGIPVNRPLVQVTQECSERGSYRLFCRLLATTDVPKLVDVDGGYSNDTNRRYIAFFPDDGAIRRYLVSANLTETELFEPQRADAFVKKHFVKGETPWSGDSGFLIQPPQVFKLTSMSNTTVKVNWLRVDGVTGQLNDTIALELPSRFFAEVRPSNKSFWQFSNLFVYGIDQILQ